MAKCGMCGNRKGQRQCQWQKAMVCSLCCGQKRQLETCKDCIHYKDPKPARRDYSVVPRFTPEMMQEDFDLQDVSNEIESALAMWDQSFGHALSDNAALRVLEKLLDHLYFKEAVEASDEQIGVGYKMALGVIEEDLSEVPKEILIKILGVIYFVAKRRAKGGRDYLDVIRKYVGTRAGKGIRILEME
jgi:hypothetical protein